MIEKKTKKQRKQQDNISTEQAQVVEPRKIKIFFSWQSDIKPMRNLIQTALDKVGKSLRDINIISVVDRDTENVPGAPDIGDTLLKKIENCNVFVADLTIVNKTSGLEEYRLTPNPNVLIELGYALHALGPERIVLIANTDEGNVDKRHTLLISRKKRIMIV